MYILNHSEIIKKYSSCKKKYIIVTREKIKKELKISYKRTNE